MQTFHRTPETANVLKAQLSVNIPLMLLGAFWIRHCAADFGADKILTSARDCNLWHEMLGCRHFARCGMPPAAYIGISRTLCYEESDAYEAYLRSNLGMRSLLVDMVGTGKSLTALVERLDLKDRVAPCILVADPDAVQGALKLEALLLRDFFRYRVFVEGLNASLEGSAVAAASDRHGARILTQPNEFGASMRSVITESRALFRSFLADLDTFQPPDDIPSLAVLRAAAESIVEELPAQARKLEILLLEQGRNLARGSVVNIGGEKIAMGASRG